MKSSTLVVGYACLLAVAVGGKQKEQELPKFEARGRVGHPLGWRFCFRAK
jgi:hypothetical protein